MLAPLVGFLFRYLSRRPPRFVNVLLPARRNFSVYTNKCGGSFARIFFFIDTGNHHQLVKGIAFTCKNNKRSGYDFKTGTINHQ